MFKKVSAIMKTRHRVWGYVALGAVVLLLAVFSFIFPGLREFFTPDNLRAFILGFGVFGFFIYIVLLSLAVPLPIPSTPVVLAGGYIFGTPVGLILALVSMVIGSFLSFYLVRWAGKPVLEKLVDKHHIDHFNAVLKKRGNVAVLISYAIPIFPSDMVSLFLGLTSMGYHAFLSLVILGHIPRLLILIMFGSGFYSGFTVWTFVVIGAAIGFVLIASFRKQIRTWMFKEIRVLEKLHLKV